MGLGKLVLPDRKHAQRGKYEVWEPIWGCTSVIPTLGRLMQEKYEFQASLGYIGRPWLYGAKDLAALGT
jgi:hypothetical protein